MHDAVIVVGSIEIIRFLEGVFKKVVVFVLWNVVPVDGDEIVAVSTRLFVPES